jgi:hypothetical protein
VTLIDGKNRVEAKGQRGNRNVTDTVVWTCSLTAAAKLDPTTAPK